MFGLFKKKKQEQPVQQVHEEIRYTCYGVNYTDVHEIEGEDMEPLKEELFEKFKQLNKVYKRSEIELITEKIGYDIWKSFHWFDITDKGVLQPQISVVYRWDDFKPGLLEEEHQKKQEQLIKRYEFYTRTMIEDASMKQGYSVYDRNNWTSFTKTVFNMKEGEVTVYSKLPKK